MNRRELMQWGAMVGGVIPGLLQENWGWQPVFTCLAIAAFVAALLLLPKWNTVPPTSPSAQAG